MFDIHKFRGEDEILLSKAWMEAYPDLFRFKYPERWRWNMFENPFVPLEKRPFCWVAERDGEIGAWTCAMAVPIDLAGQRVIGGLSIDTYTLRAYRRNGLGKSLQEMNQAAHTVFLSIDLSPKNRRNKYKIGGHPGKPLYTYLRIDRLLDEDVLYDSFLKLIAKYLGPRGEQIFFSSRNFGLARFLNAICSTLIRLKQPGTHLSDGASCDLIFEEINTFGMAVDDLWKRANKMYSFAVSRDSEYLTWRYIEHPSLSYRKFLVYRNDTAIALLIYRFPVSAEQQVGFITECFCIDDAPGIQAALIAYAVKDFQSHGVNIIKCGASTESQRGALHKLGFCLVDIDVPVFHISSKMKNLDLDALLHKDWLLSLGDHDIDQILSSHQPTFVDILRFMLGKVRGEKDLAQ